jgi:hypothetical protein
MGVRIPPGLPLSNAFVGEKIMEDIEDGIYIAEFPTDDGKNEFRVGWASAIEDIDPSWVDEIIVDAYVSIIFGNSPSFDSYKDAHNFAKTIRERLLNEEQHTTSYGICFLTYKFTRPVYKMPINKATEIISS